MLLVNFFNLHDFEIFCWTLEIFEIYLKKIETGDFHKSYLSRKLLKSSTRWYKILMCYWSIFSIYMTLKIFVELWKFLRFFWKKLRRAILVNDISIESSWSVLHDDIRFICAIGHSAQVSWLWNFLLDFGTFWDFFEKNWDGRF